MSLRAIATNDRFWLSSMTLTLPLLVMIEHVEQRQQPSPGLTSLIREPKGIGIYLHHNSCHTLEEWTAIQGCKRIFDLLRVLWFQLKLSRCCNTLVMGKKMCKIFAEQWVWTHKSCIVGEVFQRDHPGLRELMEGCKRSISLHRCSAGENLQSPIQHSVYKNLLCSHKNLCHQRCHARRMFLYRSL